MIPRRPRLRRPEPPLLFILIGAICSACATDVERPNIVFILADDLGWRDLSGEGSTFYESPNIDRIAGESMRFTQGYAPSRVCSPSRASILTGQYTARVGITDWIGAPEGKAWTPNTRLLPAHYVHQLPDDEVTLAEALHEVGYRTFFAGKWHLGGSGSLPEDHGFEVNIGGTQRGAPNGTYFAPYRNPNLSDGPNGELLPLRLARETSAFIEQHRDEPFLAFLSFYSVHTPLQTTQELWAKYRDKAARQPLPKNRFEIDGWPARQVQDHPVYAGMIESMDDAVGLVQSTLERLNLTNRTVIIFTSDNGGVSSGDGRPTSNLPLRGGKGLPWEGAIRVPYYVSWPGVTTAGSSADEPVSGIDFYPTILDIAGLDAHPNHPIDGLSLVPLFRNEPIAPRALYWHYPHYGLQGGEPTSMIREREWKLIHFYEDGRNELYNLSSDPGEKQDVSPSKPEIVATLNEKLQSWLAELDTNKPTRNPTFDENWYQNRQHDIRTKMLPKLELEHGKLLDEDWAPPDGWWYTEDP